VKRPPVNVVLLAAGRGSRIASLARGTHKSLLPVAGRSSLERALDEALARPVRQVVVVTGDQRESIEGFVRERYGERVSTVFNHRFAEDMNILSVELGVAALRRPEDGYLIVETDLVIAPGGWETVYAGSDPEESFWVTRGFYSRTLTGGAVETDASGRVTGLVYAPVWSPRYDGWQKLLGILYVAAGQVERDRTLRQGALERTCLQYYMNPWVENLDCLPCRGRPMGTFFAGSFNDPDSYHEVDQRFREAVAGGDL
jgi:hypothetical protein